MNVIFRHEELEWSYELEGPIPAVGDKVMLWFMHEDFPNFTWGRVIGRDWYLAPGTEDEGHDPYVAIWVTVDGEIPEGAIADSELWPADEEEEK